jgi:hypothetical protein
MFADAGTSSGTQTGRASIYARGGAAVAAVGEAFPGVVVDGTVGRARLAEALGRDSEDFPAAGGHRPSWC